MSIGSVLLQPQRLQRASQRAADDALLDDLISLAVYLLLDSVEGGDIARTLGASVGGTVERLGTQAGAGVNRAVTRFNTLLHPLIAPVQALSAPSENPLDAITSAEHGLEFVVGLLKGLTAPLIRQHMTEIFDILATDLGFTPTFIGDLVTGLLGDMVTALQAAPLNETAEQRSRRRAVADLLGRIRRYLTQHFTFPTISADAAAQALIDLIITPEIANALGRISCTSDALGAYLHVGDTLIKAIPYSASAPFGAGGMGAAAAPDARTEIAFYGSKLLEYDNVKSDLGKLPSTLTLYEGAANQDLRNAFLPLSIVLASSAFVYPVSDDADSAEWRVVDRKKYVLSKEGSRIQIYRLVEIGEDNFPTGDQADLSKLRQTLRENGVVVGNDLGFVHEAGSNTWRINVGDKTYNATKLDGKITVRPVTDILFDISADFQPSDDLKAPTDTMRSTFASNGIPLSGRCTLSLRAEDSEWLLDDDEFVYKVEQDKKKNEVTVSIGNFFGWVRSKVKKPKGDVVWVNAERTQVALGHRIMFVGTDVTWQNAPIFSTSNPNRHYSFKNDPATIEKWAYWVSVVQDGLHVLVDAVQIGIAAHKGEAQYKATSATLDALRLLSEFIAKLAVHRPISEVVESPYWYDLILDGLLLIPKIVEGVAKPSDPSPDGLNKFSSFVDTVMGAVLSVDPVDTNWTEAACDFVMSLITLINHIEPTPGQERPDNFQESGGFVDPFWMVGMLIYTATISIKDVQDYKKAFPCQDVAFTLGNWLAASIGLGVMTSFLGYVIAQGIAGMNPFAEPGELGKTVGVACLKTVGYFWPFLKLTHKADIDRIMHP